MPPRKQKAAKPDPAQIDLEEKIAEKQALDFSQVRPAELIAEYHLVKDEVEQKTKLFNEYIAPMRDRMEVIRQTLHGKALHDGVNAFSTDNGTAYLSTIVNHSIDPNSSYTSLDGRQSTGRDALLDWLLDNWDDFGSEGMQLNVSKDIVEKAIDEKGAPPPGLKIDVLKRLNIKKS